MDQIHDIATLQAVWTILCIVLAAGVIRALWKTTVKSQGKLMEHLEQSNESQERIASTLDSVQRTLFTIEGRTGRMGKIFY